MSTHVLDHIVHLTHNVEEASSAFSKLGFEVIPGGTHAGGVTYNALVTLSDGVYLELIAFVSANPPSSHRWGSATPGGWIDFAHLGLTPDVAQIVNTRAAKDGSGASYYHGVDGGRETPQGKVLRWRVTCPEKKHSTGRLPFFCEDVTPREWRVPVPGHHLSSALGIAHVKLLAASTEEFRTLSAQLTTVLGVPPSSANSGIVTWPLDTPTRLPGLHTHLILEKSSNVASSSGIHEIGFWVTKGHGGQADSPYGKIVWVPVP